MIEQLNNAVKFLGFFLATKTGKTGLTVTVDVRNPAGTLVVTGGAASEVGGGFYSYTLASGSVTTEGEYTAIFKTADSSVDQQHIPSLWVVGRAGVEQLDAAITSRMGAFVYTAPDNAVIAEIKAKTDLIPASPAAVGSAMTLGTDAITAAAVSAAALTKIQAGLFLAASYTAPDNTTLGRLGAMLEADGVVYRFTTNALELGPAGGGGSGSLTDEQAAQLDEIHSKTALITIDGLTVSSPVTASGNRITAKAGDTWVISLSALGAIETREKLWFSVKRRVSDADADSLLFLEETAGLSVVDGEAYETAADGAISVTDGATGALKITIDEVVTGELSAGTAYWAIKTRSATGAATTLVEGPFVITQRRIAAIG